MFSYLNISPLICKHKKTAWIIQAAKAGLTGLEPATSYVTGRHSNQLSYNPSAITAISIYTRCFDSASPPRRNFQSARCASTKVIRVT